MDRRVKKSTGDVIDVGWAKVFESGLRFVLSEQLTLVDMRVLLHLISIMKAGSNMVMNARPAALAEALSHDRANVSRSMSKLEAMHLIKRVIDPSTRVRGAQINPHVACKMDSNRRGRMIAEGPWYPPIGLG